MDNQAVILREWQDQGIRLKELDDYTLELYQNGILIARFSSIGVTLLDIIQAADDYSKRKEMN